MKRIKSLIAFAIGAAIVGCDRGPSTPSRLTPQEIRLVGVVVAGNTRLASIGETSQLTVTLQMSNGTTQPPMPANLTWITGHANVATVSGEGLLTAVGAGETTVSAQYATGSGRLSATLPVLVLPDGRFILRGFVRESGLSLDRATVQVVSGAGSGRSATGDAFGRYTLYGFEGDLTVRAAREGYTPQTQQIQLNADSRLDFSLLPSTPHVQLAPSYTFTLAASASCGDRLPEAVRSRTYVANITQDGPRVNVQLEGGNFYSTPDTTYNAFSGRVRGNTVEFTISEFYYYEFSVLDQLTETEFFAFSGFASATSVSPAGFSAPLSGYLQVFEGLNGPFGRTRPIGDCDARDHQVTFVRG